MSNNRCQETKDIYLTNYVIEKGVIFLPRRYNDYQRSRTRQHAAMTRYIQYRTPYYIDIDMYYLSARLNICNL